MIVSFFLVYINMLIIIFIDIMEFLSHRVICCMYINEFFYYLHS